MLEIEATPPAVVTAVPPDDPSTVNVPVAPTTPVPPVSVALRIVGAVGNGSWARSGQRQYGSHGGEAHGPV